MGDRSFAKICITVAVVILIICLTFMGILLWYSKEATLWPPEISECPDYWDVVGKNVCKANKGLGNTGNGSNKACSYMDFNSGQFKGKSGRRERCRWARDCGVYWDGISDAKPSVC